LEESIAEDCGNEKDVASTKRRLPFAGAWARRVGDDRAKREGKRDDDVVAHDGGFRTGNRSVRDQQS
jgi:hypothetical protein